MVGAHTALACTHHLLGNFETSGQHAMRAVQIWRSGGVQFLPEELDVIAVTSLCYEAFFHCHCGQTAIAQATVTEAISLAKDLNDMHGLTVALWYAGVVSCIEGNVREVERWASELIELSTRQHFPHWLAIGKILRGWTRAVFGDTAEGLSSIEDGIEQFRAGGSI
jgi:hypothetical protein